MSWKQTVINGQYGGDAQRFETLFADAVAEDNLQAVHCDDFIVDATTVTHLQDAGRDLLKPYQ